MNDDTGSPRTISRIIEKVFLGKEQYSTVEIAFVIAICKTTILDPNYDSLQLSEPTMKLR